MWPANVPALQRHSSSCCHFISPAAEVSQLELTLKRGCQPVVAARAGCRRHQLCPKSPVVHSSAVLLRCGALIYTGWCPRSRTAVWHLLEGTTSFTHSRERTGKTLRHFLRVTNAVLAEGVKCPSVRAQCWDQQHAGPVANCS